MQQTHGVNNTIREIRMVGGDGFEPPTYAV